MNRRPLTPFYARPLAAAAALALALLAGCSAGPKTAAAPDKPAAFWPPFPDEPRLQFLASFQKSTDVEPEKGKLDQIIYGKEPQPELPIVKPYGLAMWNGRIYVCDLRSGSVNILDLRKQQMLVMGKGETNLLQTPVAIAIAPDGVKYVGDIGRGAIYVFDKDDRHVTSFTQPGLKPVSVAVHKDELFACDFTTQRVIVFDRRDGQVRRTIGEPGNEPGQFIRPLGLTVDDQGNVFVCDVMSCKIQKFDPQGKLVTNWGTMSPRAGGLVRPKFIDVDRDGTLYVVDAAFQNVQLYDQQGRVLTFFGSAGRHPGAMQLPAGIAVHEGDLDLFKDKIHPAFLAQRLVLVTNQFGDNKVSVYAFGRLRPGKSVKDIQASKGLVPSGTTDPSKSNPIKGNPAPGDAEPGANEAPASAPAASAPQAAPATLSARAPISSASGR